MNPLHPFLQHQQAFVLDGGLATAMEARGCDLNDELWSAKLLLEDPEIIRLVHMDYLAAGADCIATVSYQATLEGFEKRGLSRAQGAELLKRSVKLAVEARDAFWEEPGNRTGRLRPLVAASIGPYGAYLADGSEYTGDYRLSVAELESFHRERWELLAAPGADLLACETIPSAPEVEALLSLLHESPGRRAWISFSCRDGERISDGTLLREVAARCDGEEQVAAVGINCVPPELLPSLIAEARRGTSKPLLVYPNSGERYDAETKTWGSTPSMVAWEEDPREWIRQGCAGVGGCCRVGPEAIASLRRSLATG
jgi:homocysteine S-methyltransferase